LIDVLRVEIITNTDLKLSSGTEEIAGKIRPKFKKT
jgi:hypothetical protein